MTPCHPNARGNLQRTQGLLDLPDGPCYLTWGLLLC